MNKREWEARLHEDMVLGDAILWGDAAADVLDDTAPDSVVGTYTDPD